MNREGTWDDEAGNRAQVWEGTPLLDQREGQDEAVGKR